MHKLKIKPKPFEILCNLQSYRLRRGWRQEELAEKVQVRRQAIIDLENCKYMPNTLLAMRLSKVLDCSIEDLFAFADDPRQEVYMPEADLPDNTRLALGRVRNKLVGFAMDTAMPYSLRAADALSDGSNSAQLLTPFHSLEENMLLLGCDPALELLGDHLRRTLSKSQVRCVFASSSRALDALVNGCAHVAASHFHNDGDFAEANVKAVREKLGKHVMPCRVLAFSLAEEGLMLARNNPLQLRSLPDLVRTNARFVNREPGAALRRLLEKRLSETGVQPETINGYHRQVRSHNEGACHVLCGAADAALGLRVVADAFGLDFLPLAVTRCDLVIPLDLERNPVVAALMDVLQSVRLRKEIEALPGYNSSVTGTEIALVA
jgi:molybdate-binding protein/DNA-binding XRE family transcriptional regulator